MAVPPDLVQTVKYGGFEYLLRSDVSAPFVEKDSHRSHLWTVISKSIKVLSRIHVHSNVDKPLVLYRLFPCGLLLVVTANDMSCNIQTSIPLSVHLKHVDVHSSQRQLFNTTRKHIHKIGPSFVPWKAVWKRIDNVSSSPFRFLSQSNLTKHMSCHSMEKTNCCPFCERHYKRKSDMVRHMKKIHKELLRVESTK